MASSSEAVFFERVRELGLTDLVDTLKARGWTTQGALAFATTYVPSQPNDDALMAQIITPLLGQDAARVPLVRRLWFEAYSATMVEIKQRVTGTAEGTSRKLTQPELIARRKATEAKVAGLKLRGELDVSDDLINAFEAMTTSQAIKFIPWEKATKRALEIEGAHVDPHFTKEGGFLKEVPGKAMQDADTSTGLKIELAMQRLGLAADMGGVMSFAVHEDLRLALRDAALETPPPGYARISTHQLRAAHKEFWNQLSLQSEGKVAPVGGVKPLDALVPSVLSCRQFEACLKYMPELPRASGSGDGGKATNPSTAASARSNRAEKRRRQLERAADAARAEERAKVQRAQPQGQQQQQLKGKSKGKGKGVSGGQMPRILLNLGCVSKTPASGRGYEANENICFAYNCPGGCTHAVAGGKCARGLHICAKCFEQHHAVGNH